MELGMATGRTPKLQYKIFNGPKAVARVDFAWPEMKLAAEYDGWEFHCSEEAFKKDRQRDRDLAALGWQVIRFTWFEVVNQRQQLIDQLARIHAQRSAVSPYFLPSVGEWGGLLLQCA